MILKYSMSWISLSFVCVALFLWPDILDAQTKEKAKKPADPRVASAVTSREASAQPAKPKSSAPEAMPRAIDPGLLEVQRTVKDTQKELESLTADITKDAEALGAQVAKEEKKVRELREQESTQSARLRQVESELEKLDQKLSHAAEGKSRAEDALELTKGELDSQLDAFRERFAGSLAVVEDPSILKSVDELKASQETATREELPARVERLLKVFESALDLARTTGLAEAPVQLPNAGGKIERVEVLRMGLLGGYYAYPAGGDAGFVLSDAEGKSGFRGEASGMSAAQKAALTALIQHPAKGGLLPSDITGGAGIASLQTRESFLRWFELGGFCMWPLLVVALTSLTLVIERVISLSFKSLGVQRRIEQVLVMVRTGRPEEAELRCHKMRGAVGAVLHAALVHREQERSVMEDAVQEALLHHAPSFQARLSFIALCAAIAPLFGLLGTVTGMITTFKMVTLFGTSDPRFMAGGISEALITTEAGLWIAIPSLLMRGILGSMADGALGRLEAGALSVVIALAKPEEAPLEVGEAA